MRTILTFVLGAALSVFALSCGEKEQKPEVQKPEVKAETEEADEHAGHDHDHDHDADPTTAANAAANSSVAAAAPSTQPVNKFCPIQPEHEVDPTVTVTYAGKVVAFCCEDCIETFNKDPEKYMASLK